MTASSAAGLLLAIAGSVILMGIITAESQYPFPYTTHDNEISDLGATRPPNSVTHQPSAAIFNGTMLATGAMIFAAAYLLKRAQSSKKAWISTGLLGLGVFGVGVFPGNFSGMFDESTHAGRVIRREDRGERAQPRPERPEDPRRLPGAGDIGPAVAREVPRLVVLEAGQHRIHTDGQCHQRQQAGHAGHAPVPAFGPMTTPLRQQQHRQQGDHQAGDGAAA